MFFIMTILPQFNFMIVFWNFIKQNLVKKVPKSLGSALSSLNFVRRVEIFLNVGIALGNEKIELGWE